jgi:hypothetical protein
MNIDLSKLKALATAADTNHYDAVALNDYGMAVPPAVVLELVAEIERHRLVEVEGCKPDLNNQPNQVVSVPCELLEQALDAAAAVGMQDVADELDRILTPPTEEHLGRLAEALPTVAVEGDQLVIRITTECLLHAVTCASQWPVDEAGNPISIINGPLLIQEIIHELQREDEQGTNPMHHLFDNAALDALDNGSEAVSHDE